MAHRIAIIAVASSLSMVLAGCGGSPTEPQTVATQRCSTTAIFAQEPFYADRGEPEQEFRGTLVFRDRPATPNGRDHRYFLQDVPVYSGGFTTEPTLKSAAGTTVTIRGKLVNVLDGPEIWPATLTSCR